MWRLGIRCVIRGKVLKTTVSDCVSIRYSERLADTKIASSVASVGGSDDNALADARSDGTGDVDVGRLVQSLMAAVVD